MLDFIYDSLDTVKKLKFPTAKQMLTLTLAIFVFVIIAGLYFVGVDTLFYNGYKKLHHTITGKTYEEIVKEEVSLLEQKTAAEQNQEIAVPTIDAWDLTLDPTVEVVPAAEAVDLVAPLEAPID